MFDGGFRQHDMIFSEKTGLELSCPSRLIGYKFKEASQIAVYTVKGRDFAVSTLYERDEINVYGVSNHPFRIY